MQCYNVLVLSFCLTDLYTVLTSALRQNAKKSVSKVKFISDVINAIAEFTVFNHLFLHVLLQVSN